MHLALAIHFLDNQQWQQWRKPNFFYVKGKPSLRSSIQELLVVPSSNVAPGLSLSFLELVRYAFWFFKNFEKLWLKLVTQGCLLKGLSGRYSVMDSWIDVLPAQSGQGFCSIWFCFSCCWFCVLFPSFFVVVVLFGKIWVGVFVCVCICLGCWLVLLFSFLSSDFQILSWLYSFIFMVVILLSQSLWLGMVGIPTGHSSEVPFSLLFCAVLWPPLPSKPFSCGWENRKPGFLPGLRVCEAGGLSFPSPLCFEGWGRRSWENEGGEERSEETVFLLACMLLSHGILPPNYWK